MQQIQRVDQINRKQLLHQQKRYDQQWISLSVIYSRTLPNLKDILTKYWHILQTNQSYKRTFNTFPIIAFRKGTSLKQMISTNTIHNNEKPIKTENNSTRCLWYQQLISTTTFKSNQTNKMFKL